MVGDTTWRNERTNDDNNKSSNYCIFSSQCESQARLSLAYVIWYNPSARNTDLNPTPTLSGGLIYSSYFMNEIQEGGIEGWSHLLRPYNQEGVDSLFLSLCFPDRLAGITNIGTNPCYPFAFSLFGSGSSYYSKIPMPSDFKRLNV